ncbi:MAG: hypothetical protein KAJ42_17280 [Gemmatimonadetes bacterium]|nr:hypothetical protein [Gemmatimonadota bacterium]
MKRGLNYLVFSQREPLEKVECTDFDEACRVALVGSLRSQTAYVIDVLASNRKAAYRFGGDKAVDRFDELGDTSKVLDRIEVRADSVGGGY